MICPSCKADIDLDEEELDEGDPVTCDECGVELSVASTNPVELEVATDEDDEEDDEEEDFDEEGDEDEDEFEEEEEKDDEWS